MTLLTTTMPESFDEMVAQMLKCGQTERQTVYQHGQSVWLYYTALIEHLVGDRPLNLDKWRMPDWLNKYREQFLANRYSEEVEQLYTLFHDCGKPFCRSIDELGRVHFPDHANVSRVVWEHVGGDPVAAKLIGFDMAIHTSSAEEIDQLLATEWTTQDAVTLLLAALAEIHSNASMFGGIDSNSFKIKWKVLDRRGKQICRKLFE